MTILTDVLSLLVLTMCVTTLKSGFNLFGLALQLADLAGFILVIVVVSALSANGSSTGSGGRFRPIGDLGYVLHEGLSR